MVKISVFVGAVMFCGCSLMSGKQEPLTFIKQQNNSNRLRLDGCYYSLDSSRSHVSVFVFYKNGIVSDVGTYESSFLDSIMIRASIPLAGKKMKQIPWVWGLYKIVGDSILTEKWYPVGGDYLPGINHGFILNDTTFRFTALKFLNKTPMVIDETFHFLELKQKPDSTNNFIPLN